jgi:uncharacterized lipoprotein YmbA
MKYIIIFILGLAGCSSGEPEQHFLPFDENEYENFARKSVTINDYKDNDDEC